ncbi:MAG: hypothetical protein HUU16_16810 [Candidatus Omnitrophica bacterium]|nr:hypothetical protein [Candidatus Omnitrophota bacterium]
MRIAIHHLTRMQAGFFCAAGIDWSNGAHVRPVLPNHQRLETRLLECHGGPFEIGALLDLGEVTPCPSAPESEDHLFDPRRVRRLERVRPELFWKALQRIAKSTFRELFGEDLQRVGIRKFAVEAGKGCRSLGCLAPNGRLALRVAEAPGKPPRVQLKMSDGNLAADLSVTDIRLYGGDHVTPDRKRIDQVAGRLSAGVPAIIAVGLTRPFAASVDQDPMHWLQVNNIHLEDNPVSRLSSG